MVGFIADEVKFFKKNKRSTHDLEDGIEEGEKPLNVITEVEEPHQKIQAFLPQHGKPWYKIPYLVKLNWLLVIVSLTSTNTGFDGSLLNALQSIPDWSKAMGSPTGAVLGAVSNGVVFGCALGFFFASWISDKFGRRNAITVGNSMMIIGAIIQSCSGVWLTVKGEYKHNDKRAYAMFLVARIILGMGNATATTSSPPLVSELSYPTHRQTMTAFYNSNWYLGAIIAAWISFGTRNMEHNWSWRIPSIFQGLFPLIQIVLIYQVPESPRFLIYKGRNTEAREILLKYHAGGDEAIGGALVDFEMSEIELAIEQDKLANSSSYADFLKTPGNRKRLFLIIFLGVFMQLSGNGLVAYYLNKVLNSIGITSSDEQLVFNGGLMIYNYGVALIINLFVFQNVKRRTAFVCGIGAMMVTYIIWTILSAINQQRNFQDTALGKGVMAMIFIFYGFYNLCCNGLPYLYVTEITPFILRSRAINLNYTVQNIVLIYNGFVNPIAMDAIDWKYYIVYCCILGVELLVAYLTIVETSGRTLEEVAEVFGEGIHDMDIKLIKDRKSKALHVENANDSSIDYKSESLMTKH